MPFSKMKAALDETSGAGVSRIGREKGEFPLTGCPRQGAPVRGNSLPSLSVTTQSGWVVTVPSHTRKAAELLAITVEELARKYGVERIGFLTLTFADGDARKDGKEAQRRWNSLASNVIRKRYDLWIKVRERDSKGNLHYHVIVVMTQDIRTGFDFDAVNRRRYGSVSKYLLGEWAFWRVKCEKYGFGRHQLYPVRTNSEAMARYVSGYVTKGFGCRLEEDKGARTVSYSKAAKRGTTHFSRLTVGGWLWRAKLAVFAKRHGCNGLDDLRSLMGPSWAYHFRDSIYAQKLEKWPSEEHWKADLSADHNASVEIGEDGCVILCHDFKEPVLDERLAEIREALDALEAASVSPAWSPVPPPKEKPGCSDYTPPGQNFWMPAVSRDYKGNVIKKDGKAQIQWRIVRGL